MNLEDFKKEILRLNEIKFKLYLSSNRLFGTPRNLVVCYIHYFYTLVKATVFCKWKTMNCKELLFIAPTLNNQRTLLPIIEGLLPQHEVTLITKFRKSLPYSRIYWHSLCHIIKFQKVYNQLSDSEKIVVRSVFTDFIAAHAFYVAIDRFVRKNKQLKFIVFANDHILVNRCFIESAIKYHIKTIYTQHASVSKAFPSLSFNYSFLDGKESYEKYQQIGNIHGKVFISGSPRFDALKDIHPSSVKCIGIAVNALDNLAQVKRLCEDLTSLLHEHLIVRPHPSMEKLSIWQELKDKGYEISYPTQENSFKFASRIKFLIANESSIHLDCNLMKTPSILYNLSDHPVLDYYSYVKNGLITYCDSEENLLKLINSGLSIDVLKVKYYNAALGTQHECKVGKLIAEIIDSVLNGKEEVFIKRYFIKESEEIYCYK